MTRWRDMATTRSVTAAAACVTAAAACVPAAAAVALSKNRSGCQHEGP
jgi:hypothetical protein